MTTSKLRRTERIVVVDDDLARRETIAEQAGALGFSIQAFSDWKSALREIHRTRCDLLITDLFLNGVSGIDLIKEVKAISPASAVIVVTPTASIETAIESIREGAYDYLTMPFTVGTLEVAINRALEHRRLLRESKEK